MVGYTRSYGVWIGDDLVEEYLPLDEALLLAKKERKDNPLDISVVVDEIRHYHIQIIEDVDDLEDGKVFVED
jgi:hypothetical protein